MTGNSLTKDENLLGSDVDKTLARKLIREKKMKGFEGRTITT